MSEQARQSLSITLSQSVDAYGTIRVTFTLIPPSSADGATMQMDPGPRQGAGHQGRVGLTTGPHDSAEELGAGVPNAAQHRWLETQREYRLLLERLKKRQALQLKPH